MSTSRAKGSGQWPNWLPELAVKWAEQVAGRIESKAARMAPVLSDDRMQSFWTWHDTVLAKREHDERYDEWTLLFAIDAALRLPGKPSNLSKAKREKYFEDVRRHAEALQELLAGTIFEAGSFYHGKRQAKEVTRGDLARYAAARLTPDPGGNDIDRVVAFAVDGGRVFALSHDYPNCEIVDRLQDVVSWTRWDGGWAYDFQTSSRPLDRAKEFNGAIAFFTCNVHEVLARFKVRIPNGELANLANVALRLESGSEIDEDGVRKTVQRHSEARAALRTKEELEALWWAPE